MPSSSVNENIREVFIIYINELVSDFDESKSTIRGKYGYDFKEFKNLVDEIIERCNYRAIL